MNDLLEKKPIVIVGVGALGSHVLQFIRNLEVDITIIDFDRLEKKNTAAQFQGMRSVGKMKTAALQELMHFMWSWRPAAFHSKLWEGNEEALLGTERRRLIVDCLDNAKGRRILQAHVRKHDLPCIHGALAVDGQYGRVVWDKEFAIDSEDVAGQATCDGGEHLPFIGVVSCLLAHAIQTWVKTSKHIGYSISPGGVTRI